MKNKFALTVFVAFASLLGLQSALAAIPGFNSTSFNPKLGIYRSPLGFQVGAGDSGWEQVTPPKDNRFIATIYRAPGAKDAKDSKKPADSATLTVRVDHLNKEVALDKYVQRWMKEYPKYGFDVLGSKPFAQGKQRGYVLDLINRDSGKQMRQVLFMKKAEAVIMTCRDQKQNFTATLKGCNSIIRTFSWE